MKDPLLVRVPDVKLRAVTTDSLFAWRPLTPRVSLVEGNGANSVVIANRREVLLVDTKETGFGGALRAEVERVVGRPVTCVVSTHHHTDHVMGNPAFTADVPVIAQRRGRERTIARATRALVELVTAEEQDRPVRGARRRPARLGAGTTDTCGSTTESARNSSRSLKER